MIRRSIRGWMRQENGETSKGQAVEELAERSIKTLVEYIVQALVDNPEQIIIAERTGRNTTIIELAVAKEDIGKVIGKEGRTINAIRTILNAAGASQKKRVVLEVMGWVQLIAARRPLGLGFPLLFIPDKNRLGKSW